MNARLSALFIRGLRGFHGCCALLACLCMPGMASGTPTLVVTPTSLNFGAVAGATSPQSQTVQISTTETIGVSWNATVTLNNGSGWLTATPLTGSTPGALQVTVNPSSMTAGAYTATITITAAGVASSPQSLTITHTMVPGGAAGGPQLVVGAFNAASYSRAGALPGAIAPGSIVSIFGTGLATGAGSAASLPLPTSLHGAEVRMNGVLAPLFYVSPTQINAQVPWVVRAGGLEIQIFVNGVASNVCANFCSGSVQSDAPGVFTFDQNGSGPGVVVRAADGTFVNSANPARAGEYLTIYASGLGPVTNRPATGAGAPVEPLSVLQQTPTVAIDGVLANVTFAGLTPGFAGLYQINVQVPEGLTRKASALGIASGVGAANLTTVETAGAADVFTTVTGRTDSEGNFTASFGSLSIPVKVVDRAGGFAYADASVAVTIESGDRSYAAVVVVDDRFPPQGSILRGRPAAATAFAEAAFAENALDRVTVPVSRPAESQAAFSSAFDEQSGLADFSPVRKPPSLANALIAGLKALIPTGPTSEAVVEAAEAARQISRTATVWDVSRELHQRWLQTVDSSAAALPIASVGVASGQALELSGALYPLAGFSHVKLTRFRAGNSDLFVVTPVTPGPRAATAPARRTARVCLSHAAAGAEITLLSSSATGPAVYSARTDAQGCVSMPLFAGTYTARASGEGFFTNDTNLDLRSADATATLNVRSFALEISKIGSGTVNATQFSCGTDCSWLQRFIAPADTVRLTAVPGPGSAFQGWSGDCTGAGECSVTMNGRKRVIANFSGDTVLTVTKTGSGLGTVTSSPAGISCGTACSAGFPAGTAVTLTAVANAGHSFTGWSGACTGAGLCRLTMDGSKQVTANFVSNVTLTVTKAGNGRGVVTSTPAGINCGGVCSSFFASGSTVTLAAAAESNHVFAGWSGACTGTGACTVSMTSDRQVTATFTSTDGTYAGPAIGSTTTKQVFGCRWSVAVSADITAVVTGGGTASQPYSGTFSIANGRAVLTPLPGFETCGTDTFTFTGSAPITGSAGVVQSSGTVSVGSASADFSFTNGTFSADRLAGNITINSTTYFETPVTQALTLTRR